MTVPAGVQLTVRSESVQQIYSAYRADRYRVNRRYQRKLVWAVEEKQRLIDSMLLALPLPLFLVAETGAGADAPLELIDGMQRLNAILSFIEQEFDYKGSYFDLDTLADTKDLKDGGDLNQRLPVLSRQQSVNLANYSLALSVFRADNPSSIDEVFRRINSGGRRLSKQELRQAGTVSPLADVVRRLAASIRGDSSPGDIVPLRSMPLLSISNRSLDYGLDVEQLFWVKQGIARREDVRESLDEQIILDILLDLFVEPMRTTNGTTRDLFYSYTPQVGDADSGASKDIEVLLETYGQTRLNENFLAVYDVIRQGIEKKTSSFAQQTGIHASGRGGRYFHALFVAVWELMFKTTPARRFQDYNLLSGRLQNIAAATTIPPGGDWTVTFKRQTIDSFKGVLTPATIAVSESDTDDAGLLSWVAQLETLLNNARVESSLLECKQGFLTLGPDRKFNESNLAKILQTLAAMSNGGPTSTGYVVVGVADSKSDAEKVAQLDGGDLIKHREFFVTGIDREASLSSMTLNDYWHSITQKVSTNGALGDPYKIAVLKAVKLVSYHNRMLVVFRAPRVTEPVFYAGTLYDRVGSSVLTVPNGPPQMEIAKRFFGAA